MVVIGSIEEDISTNKVMDWLRYKHEVPHCRINNFEWFSISEKTSFKLGRNTMDGGFRSKNTQWKLDDVVGVWFRKDMYAVFSKDVGHTEETNHQVNEHLKDEHYYAKHGLYELLKKQAKQVIGGRLTNQPQKINNLIVAQSLGIDIPNTLVTTRKKDLLDFYKENNGAITKPVTESKPISNGKEGATMYVMNIPKEELEYIPTCFAPSLFQERLDIAFDIRVFYLDGAFYPIAIFTSQEDPNRVDVRNAATKIKEFRRTKYKLSQELEQLLSTFMDTIGLVSGSLDLVQTKNGRIVFLEVNPWGQYDHVELAGNYFINEKIAEYLVHGSQRK